ncbi:unnamed protein product [Phyllotreta striolata]|uniref:Gustatory receptor n=1 Tax=Phyllotreta striolata TaxID=444603 RepID=A0A9N9XTK4_PHYSR|nr:unnamed protein product [Phyllotreta striolata]
MMVLTNPPNKDITIFNYCYLICFLFGLVPHKSGKKISTVAIIVFWILCLGICLRLAGILYQDTEYLLTRMFVVILAFMLIIFSLFSLHIIFKKIKQWKNVLENVKMLDEHLGSIEKLDFSYSAIAIFDICCLIAVPIMMFIFLYEKLHLYFKSLLILATITLNKYVLEDILFVRIMTILKTRLLKLNRIKNVIFISPKVPLNRRLKLDDIDYIKKGYKYIYFIMQDTNLIYEKMFLLKVTNSFMEIILIYQFVIEQNAVFTSTAFTLFHFYFILRSIMCCDSVEKLGKDLGTWCKVLQTEIEDPRLKQELSDLTNLIESLPLNFSLFGLFQFNNQLIPTILSGITSYLIIIMQFKSQRA